MFHNYGDRNFFEHGVLVNDSDDPAGIEMLRCEPFPEEEGRYMFSHLFVDPDADFIAKDEVMSYIGMTDESYDPILFAIGATEYYSWENFGAVNYVDDYLDRDFADIIDELEHYDIAQDEVETGSVRRGEIGAIYYDAHHDYAAVRFAPGRDGGCFKDKSAAGDEICYIAESNPTTGYSRNDMMDLAKKAANNDLRIDVAEYAQILFDECEGKSPEDVLKEITSGSLLKTFIYGFRVEGRYYAVIHARNLEAAQKKAEDAYYAANFGDLEVVEGELVNICTPEGDFLYEK